MELKRIQSGQDSDFERYWALYCISFPEFEQRTQEDQIRALSDSRYHCNLIMDGDLFAGLLTYWEFADYDYLEHLAINPDLRGKHYGTKALTDFCSKHSPTMLEIDPPEDDISIRREHFYHNQNFKTSDYEYVHPGYRSDAIPHRLRMMSYPKKLTEAQFQQFKDDMANTVMIYSERAPGTFTLDGTL